MPRAMSAADWLTFGVSGVPELAVNVAVAVQSPTIFERKLPLFKWLRSLPNGNCQLAFIENCWRRSKLESAYSAARFWSFWATVGLPLVAVVLSIDFARV